RDEPRTAIADALLDQRRIAGVGNVLKSEALFLAGLCPFTAVGEVPDERLRDVIAIAQRLLRQNVITVDRPRATARAGSRNTTGSLDPAARLWVYGRSGRPCRRCGAAIAVRRSGPHARSTYWCPNCQQR
ncbi:MAG TPA: zinc finger domain-containing protein, partial [Gemmatimonadaceae bacterium]|nr:zinc finger domain-containing protein [Gemmatimonadaceae bacterium]